MTPKLLNSSPVDLRLKTEGREARFTNRIDEATQRFEEELCLSVDLPLPQRQVFLAASSREFRLFQMWDAAGRPAMQIALNIYRPSRLKKMARAFAHRMGAATAPAEELVAFKLLRKFCTAAGDLMTLRLQPIRGGSEALDSFTSHGLSAGFEPAAPMSYTRTLKCELEGSLEDIQMRMSKKTRPKLRHRTRNEINLVAMTDAKFIPQCKAAMKASFERTGGDAIEYDFEAAFELARTQPKKLVIYGIFLPHRPDELLAFVIGRHGGGEMAEYSAAGSLADAELRKMPFNYFLVWELMQWAHSIGAKSLDLGGITPGGPDDPRASISEFKRHLCENEVEISREIAVTLQPVRAYLFEKLNRIRQARSKPSTQLAAGVASATALFAAISTSMLLAGSPSSPALARLAHQSRVPAIAIIGDSRAHAGLSPTELVRSMSWYGVSGHDAYNYAVDGTDVLHHYSLVAHGLSAPQNHPKLVIWTPNPLQFNANRQNNRLEQLRISDIPALFSAGAPIETLFDLATMTLFPPYRERPLVKHLLFEDYAGRAEIRLLGLQERALGLREEREPLSRKYHDLADGQSPFAVLNWPSRFRRGSEGYIQDYQELELSDWHFNLARALMRKVRESGALLLMVEMPVAPYFQLNIATQAKHQEWRARMHKLAAQEGALFWSHADRFNNDHFFGDPGHMSETTAFEYSQFLGKEIAGDPTTRAALERERRL